MTLLPSSPSALARSILSSPTARCRIRAACCALAAVALLGTPATPAAATPPITFHDVTSTLPDAASFQRVPSTSLQVARDLQAMGTAVLDDFIGPSPIKPHGAPGVALLDVDGDGDLDI